MHIKTQRAHQLPHLHFRKPALKVSSSSALKSGLLKKPAVSRVRVKVFVHEYSLPLVVTTCFFIAVSSVAVLRASERSALLELLPTISVGGQDYASFLSGDKSDEFTKNQDNQDTPQPAAAARTATPVGSASSININSGSTPSAGGGGGQAATPATPFSSAIASFQQSGVALECVGGKQNKGSCSKRYTFAAGVRTSGGPGTVSYSWRSNLQSANQDASFAVGSGTIVTSLQKQIVLACNNPVTYSLQLVINSPSVAQSNSLTVVHNCNDI